MQKFFKFLMMMFLFILSLFIQLFVFNNMDLFGVKPNLLLINVIVISIYTNIYISATYSFILGFIVDLLFGGSGMFTISYTAIGIILGLVNGNYMKENYVSTIILTIISVCIFETVQYIQSMIILSAYVSIWFLIRQILFSLVLNVVLVFMICFVFDKINMYIDKKNNKLYW